jgi:hypothetical protein
LLKNNPSRIFSWGALDPQNVKWKKNLLSTKKMLDLSVGAGYVNITDFAEAAR